MLVVICKHWPWWYFVSLLPSMFLELLGRHRKFGWPLMTLQLLNLGQVSRVYRRQPEYHFQDILKFVSPYTLSVWHLPPWVIRQTSSTQSGRQHTLSRTKIGQCRWSSWLARWKAQHWLEIARGHGHREYSCPLFAFCNEWRLSCNSSPRWVSEYQQRPLHGEKLFRDSL